MFKYSNHIVILLQGVLTLCIVITKIKSKMKCTFIFLLFALVGSHVAAIEQSDEVLAELLRGIKTRNQTGNYTAVGTS